MALYCFLTVLSFITTNLNYFNIMNLQGKYMFFTWVNIGHDVFVVFGPFSSHFPIEHFG